MEVVKLFFKRATMKIGISSLYTIMLLSSVISSYGQQVQHHGNDHLFPHPVNSTMGIPDPIGSFNIRLNAFRQQTTDGVEYDLSGHLGYGLFEWGGIHLRSLGVKTTPFTEVIGMVGLWRNKERTQGISLLGIVGIPTGAKKEGQHHGLAYLFGFTGRIAKEDLLTNDIILHYDLSAAHFIAETGTVVKLSPILFATLDLRGTFGESRPDISILPSVKWKLIDSGFIAFGFHAPLTKSTAFKNQIIIQIELGSH
ncbi:MAG: hypothetical protein KJ666_13925 [Bacteroidetes bacterium]|nr:hypothetical protein [Bacteroidota bacterium]MBU2584388.1 hypothetical protein [Bacteroidota bacterium]